MPAPKDPVELAIFKNKLSLQMSLCMKGRSPWNKGKVGCITGWIKGKSFTEDHRRKISLALFGKIHSKQHNKKVSSSRTGIILSKEARGKISQGRCNGIADGSIKLFSKYCNTKIELNLEKELLKQGFMVAGFEHGFHIRGVGVVDRFLPEYNIIIECDGDYWHCNPKSHTADYFNKTINMFAKDKWKEDADRDNKAITLGYHVFRFWESDINQDVSACVKQILQSI